MKTFVTDNHGRRYQIKILENSDHFFIVEVRHQGEYVGIAKCALSLPDTMELSDIKIRDDSDPPENIIDHMMKSIPSSKRDAKSYRHIGLGTALLKLVVDHAREKQVKRVFGSIVKKDIDRTPDLIAWYEKRGFRRCNPYPSCVAEAVAWICLDLS